MKFQLIHKETGLTLRQYKKGNKLKVYNSGTHQLEEIHLVHDRIRYLLREDGAIAIQRVNPWYDQGEIYFLKREDWEIKWATPHIQ